MMQRNSGQTLATTRATGEPADVTVVVVNYNTAHLLYRMFAALEAAKAGLTLQVIVVDNASPRRLRGNSAHAISRRGADRKFDQRGLRARKQSGATTRAWALSAIAQYRCCRITRYAC